MRISRVREAYSVLFESIGDMVRTETRVSMKMKNTSIVILTYLQDADAVQFARLRRKKWTGWKLLVRGKWSHSPFHQGRTSFYISHTEDKCYWALLHRTFPQRIVAVAQALRERRGSPDSFGAFRSLVPSFPAVLAAWYRSDLSATSRASL